MGKEQEELALIEQAQQEAPSYLRMPDDGADFICSNHPERDPYSRYPCEGKGRKGFLLTFTPNGKRELLCPECVEEDWLARAKDMGQF